MQAPSTKSPSHAGADVVHSTEDLHAVDGGGVLRLDALAVAFVARAVAAHAVAAASTRTV